MSLFATSYIFPSNLFENQTHLISLDSDNLKSVSQKGYRPDRRNATHITKFSYWVIGFLVNMNHESILSIFL